MFKFLTDISTGLSKRKQQSIAIGLVFTLGVALIGFALYQAAAAKKFRLYTNDQIGFSIKYPADWAVRENMMSEIPVVFVSPKEGPLDVFQENLSVVVQDLSQVSTRKLSFDMYTQIAIQQIVGVFKERIEVLEEAPTRLAGRQAYRFVYQGTDKTDPLLFKIMHVWCLDKGRGFQLNYGGLTARFDQYLGDAKVMIKSFKIE